MAAFTSGPKIFPICPEEAEESDVGKLTFYPLGVDWDTLFKWYFRVKTWKVEFFVNFTASGSTSGVSASVTVPSPRDASSTTNITDESDFSCTTPLIQAYPSPIYEEGGDDSPDASISILIFNLTPPSSTLFGFKILYKDGLFYPYIRFSFNTSAAVAGTGTDGNIDTSALLFSNPNVADTDPVDVPFEIDGQTGVVQWSFTKNVFNEGDATSDVTLDIINLKMTPEEYWEYDPGDGAYYDSTDGSELRDPWSYQP